MEEPTIFTGDSTFGNQKPFDMICNNNQFITDDLFVDFPSNDDVVLNDEFFGNVIGNSADSGSEGPFSGNVSSRSFDDSQFSGVELCRIPYDDMAELEWLSDFTQESFSTVEVQNLHIISTAKNYPATDTSSSATTPELRPKPVVPYRINSHIFQTDIIIPGKARSKRPRSAPSDWTTRIRSFSNTIRIKLHKTNQSKRREIQESSITRCLHCGSDKTPQWRTGPMGPKTLCNACGVRYKSGRLVPEYRPASSPTFVSTKHSNSHRKVMEIRRQKEFRIMQNQLVNRNSVLLESIGTEDCLIDHQDGLGFMHMI